MKKIIVLMVMAFASLGSYAVVDGEKNNPDIPIKIKIEIDFGRKKLGCLEFGICVKNISIDWDLGKTVNGGHIGALTNVDGMLELSFNKSDLSSATIKKYFSGEYFIIDEDVVLNSKYLPKINLPETYVIRTGEYRIKKLETSYVIMLE